MHSEPSCSRDSSFDPEAQIAIVFTVCHMTLLRKQNVHVIDLPDSPLRWDLSFVFPPATRLTETTEYKPISTDTTVPPLDQCLVLTSTKTACNVPFYRQNLLSVLCTPQFITLKIKSYPLGYMVRIR